jgi:hypothetical protein
MQENQRPGARPDWGFGSHGHRGPFSSGWPLAWSWPARHTDRAAAPGDYLMRLRATDMQFANALPSGERT